MAKDKQYYVYIITTTYNTVLYTGVTTDIDRRIEEHRTKAYQKSFSARYEVKKLVYFEAIDDYESAMLREKQIKGWSRLKKRNLVTSRNPKWKDLYKM